MGGDHGPSVTVPASLVALAKHPHLHLILVGDAAVLETALKPHTYDTHRLRILHANEQVEMDEPPATALRKKKDSSMRIAINQVKEGKAEACVSAGNTGALMAIAKFVLKTLPGIDRPAIISTFPTIVPKKNMRMLDLGANVDSSAEHLFQFAVMGSLLASALENIESPNVYLLNIGAEAIKGNEQVKQTDQLLTNTQMINYRGFIEGDALYKGEADVVVCDGFVGNVALKTTEGVAGLLIKLMKQALMRNSFTKLIGLLVQPVIKPFINRINPSTYNGATFIGLKGTVVKSHGSATAQGFARAIEEAMMGAEKNIPERIQDEFLHLLSTTLPSQTPKA
jgi:glycerol-3-phosphate acyltransferase PlsX